MSEFPRRSLCGRALGPVAHDWERLFRKQGGGDVMNRFILGAVFILAALFFGAQAEAAWMCTRAPRCTH